MGWGSNFTMDCNQRLKIVHEYKLITQYNSLECYVRLPFFGEYPVNIGSDSERVCCYYHFVFDLSVKLLFH